MVKVKICGLRRPEDIAAANDVKPDYIGFIFAPSRRRVTPEEAAGLARFLRREIKKVGVFVNGEIDFVAETVRKVGLDVVQLHGEENHDYIAELRRRLPERTRVWLKVGMPVKRCGSDLSDKGSTAGSGEGRTVGGGTAAGADHGRTEARAERGSAEAPQDHGSTENLPGHSGKEGRTEAGFDLAEKAGAGKGAKAKAAEKGSASAETGRPVSFTQVPAGRKTLGDADALLLDTAAGHGAAAGGTGQAFDWDLARGLCRQYKVIVAGGLSPANVREAIKTLHPYGVDVSTHVETAGYKDKDKMALFVDRAREVRQ